MASESPFYQYYENALDDIHSQLSPDQLSYLLSVLSSSKDKLSESFTETDDINFSKSSLWSPDSSSTGKINIDSYFRNHVANQRSLSKDKEDSIDKRKSVNQRTKVQNKSFDKKSKSCRHSGLPPQLPSFESTLTTINKVGGESLISRHGVTSKGSSVKALEVEKNILENMIMVQQQYSQVPVAMPVVKFTGEVADKQKKPNHSLYKKCSNLPSCKRIAGRYPAVEGRSRSSSVETVRAESLPDLDNPFYKLAGKISNEPINPFPILKTSIKYTRSTTGKPRRSTGASLDISRIEQEIDLELHKEKDYKNVSEFFSRSKKSKNVPDFQKKSSKLRNPEGGACNLSKRVANPLYKVYDPTGYHKSEDELALECIQTLCDDFNKWITSLAGSKKKDECNTEVENKNDQILEAKVSNDGNDTSQLDISVIGPEFLLQILRKDLELPENPGIF